MRITSRERKARFLFPDGCFVGMLTSTGVLQVTTVDDGPDDSLLLLIPAGVGWPTDRLSAGDMYVQYDGSAHVVFDEWHISVIDTGTMSAYSSSVHEDIEVEAGVENEQA